MPGNQQAMIEPLEEPIDHVRGPVDARLIVEYGDYECPYSRQAYRAIELVDAQLSEGVRFAFRHFPLTEIHPHALAASLAAEAAARQDRFWEMHEMLFHRQHALTDATCAAMRSSSGSTSRGSTQTAAARRRSSASAATFAAELRPVRCMGRRPCSSRGSSIAAATTQQLCGTR